MLLEVIGLYYNKDLVFIFVVIMEELLVVVVIWNVVLVSDGFG